MRRHVALTLAVVALVALAGCSGVLPGGNDGGTVGETNTVQYVPGNANMLVTVDASVTQDATTRTVLNAGSERTTRINSTSDAFAEFENETGLNPEDANEITAYSVPNENDGEYPQSYTAAIVTSDWSTDKVTTELTEQSQYNYSETTVGDVTVYVPDVSDDTMYSSPTYYAVLGNGDFIAGDEQAVYDAVAVENGNADPLSGELKSAYDEKTGGYAAYAYEVPESQVPDQTYQGLDISVFQGVSVVAGSYDTASSGNITVENTFKTGSDSAAQDVADVTDGGISLLSGMASEDAAKQQLRNIEVTRDGSSVTVSYEGNAEALAELLSSYQSTPPA